MKCLELDFSGRRYDVRTLLLLMMLSLAEASCRFDLSRSIRTDTSTEPGDASQRGDTGRLDGGLLGDAAAAQGVCGAAYRDEALFNGKVYYIAPDGADTDDGLTRSSPWKTFAHAIVQLGPADTLVLLDGIYGEGHGTGALEVDCSLAGISPGSQDRPIRVCADNERQALIEAPLGATSAPLLVDNCWHWVFQGLRVKNIDDANVAEAENGSTILIEDSKFITLRRMLASDSNRYHLTRVFDIKRCEGIVVEDSEAYRFHHIGFEVGKTDRAIFRRNYANGVDGADLPGGYDSGCAHIGGRGFLAWTSKNVIFENNIAESTCRGLQIGGAETTNAPFTEDNQLLGNIAIDSAVFGFFIESICHGVSAADITNTSSCMAYRTRLLHNVAYRCETGLRVVGGLETQISQFTSIDHANSGVLFELGNGNGNMLASQGGPGTSLSLENALSVASSGAYGFRNKDALPWEVQYCNAFGQTTNYDPLGDAAIVNSLEENPALGSCAVYIPSVSLMKGRGEGGRDIGANILLRYENGELTNNPLWDPTRGVFPCAAIIAGINDGENSCSTVHKRLHLDSACVPPLALQLWVDKADRPFP